MTRRVGWIALAGALTAAWSVPAAAACRYDVAPDAAAGLANLVLDVSIACDRPLAPDDFAFEYRAAGLAEWADDGALRYSMPVGRLARERSRSDFAATAAGVLAPLGAWLAAPAFSAGVERLEIAFRPAPGVTPVVNLREEAGRFVLDRRDWRFGGYGVFAARAPLVATAPGPAAFPEPGRPGPAAAEIRIAVLDDGFEMRDADFVAWIERFAGLTARFWAGFPSDRLLIAITPGGRLNNPFGRVRGGGGATMMLRLNRRESPAFLNAEDWVLTHEMIHLGAPFAPTRNPWFMEGMATYLEPLIRALGGATTRQLVWAEWLRAMPTGALALNQVGLEGRGHPYWTGALYFLKAHIEFVRMGRPDGLAACFRAMRRDLGDAASRATVNRLIETCDRAVGAPVLADLRRRHSGPAEVDLRELWRSLGVDRSETGVIFSDVGVGLRHGLFDDVQFPQASP